MPTPPSPAERIEANRVAWNSSAVHHGQGAAWDGLLAGFATPGFSVLDATLTGLLRDIGVAGRSVVQIGCNNGRELLSCRALGATACMGIDQSEAFLAQAERLRAVAGSNARFVAADVYRLPDNPPLPRSDIALITIGVLNWMPDLPGFFRQVASLVAPGGHLLIYETHPFLEMFDPDLPRPFEPSVSYFREEPLVWQEALVYDGADLGPAPPSYWHLHRLGDVLNASIAAGFHLMALQEYPHSIREVEYDRYEAQAAQLPLSYSLVARRA